MKLDFILQLWFCMTEQHVTTEITLIANICCIAGIAQSSVLLRLRSAELCNALLETFCMFVNFHSWPRLRFDPKILPSSIQCVRVEATNNSIES